MANGAFYLVAGNAGDTGPVNPGGFERGIYTWDAQGRFAFTFRQDLNGSAGFSEMDGLVLSATVVGDTLTLRFPVEFCEPGEDCSGGFPLTRVAGGAASIVGGFLGGDAATDDDSFVVILLENGTFFFAGDQPDVDGIEKGTYTWDPVTHDFHVTSKVLDTNGPDEGANDANVVLSPDGLTVTATGPGGVTVLTRIGSFAPSGLRLNGVAAPAGISVSAGTPITVEVTNGPGQVGDWLGLARAGDPAHTYLAWKYLGNTQSRPASPLATAVVTFIAPATAGNYEVRLFRNDTLTLVATSGTIAVTVPEPTLSLNSVAPPTGISVGIGATVTVDLTNGPGLVGDWLGLARTGDPPVPIWRGNTSATRRRVQRRD